MNTWWLWSPCGPTDNFSIIVQQHQTIHQLVHVHSIHCHPVIHGINLHLIVVNFGFVHHYLPPFHASKHPSKWTREIDTHRKIIDFMILTYSSTGFAVLANNLVEPKG